MPTLASQCSLDRMSGPDLREVMPDSASDTGPDGHRRVERDS
jgi:hypothetical protein